MRRGGRSFTWRSRLPALAVTLAAPLLLYLIAGWGFGPIAPADPVPLLRLQVYQSLAPDSRIAPETQALARSAAREAPLAFEPFFIQARIAEQAGRLEEATQLMEEARRRRSNFVPTRLQLAAYYLRDARPADMFSELEIALRLNEDIRQAVLPEMAKLIRDPAAREALAAALANGPGWRRAFFDAARGQDIAPDDALALWNAVRARNPRGGAALERQLYVHALLEDGQAARARALWLASLPEAEQRRNALLFDGTFSGKPAQPPFGWELHQVDVGRAEMAGGDGADRYLEVNYFGGHNAVLAEQVLALAPGRYRLNFAAQSEEGVEAASLRWSLVCHGSGQEFARIPIENLRGQVQTLQGAFTVPATGCPGQRLRLVAEPGDISTPIALRIRAVEIVR